MATKTLLMLVVGAILALYMALGAKFSGNTAETGQGAAGDVVSTVTVLPDAIVRVETIGAGGPGKTAPER